MNPLFAVGRSKGGMIMYVFLAFVILLFSFFEDAMLGTNIFVKQEIRYILWVVLPAVMVYGLWTFFKKRREEANAYDEFGNAVSTNPVDAM